jgi:DUF1680 family protein
MTDYCTITSPYWYRHQEVNANKAIFHQWEMLEISGCIDNFRLAAGLKEGLREGWFFADSDAYKWLDAAARIYATSPSNKIKHIMDMFISILSLAQEADGYLYTYNQIFFPGSRWENLLIEHEFYCIGHLIEAGVSHFKATKETTALDICKKSADLLVTNFLNSRSKKLDGHEEVEIALLQLYQVTLKLTYLELASAFLDRRGRRHPFAPMLITQYKKVEKRKSFVINFREAYLAAHLEYIPRELSGGNYSKAQKNSSLRWLISALSGKYFQMHTPIRRQVIPVGHAVRFCYLETATSMLARLTEDPKPIQTLEKAWERMVSRRMYVTGGLGAVPGMEGFGRDNELDPEYAYAETCAALACIFWNREMAQITKNGP